MKRIAIAALVLVAMTGIAWASTSTYTTTAEIEDRRGNTASVVVSHYKGRTAILLSTADRHRINKITMVIDPEQATELALGLGKAVAAQRGAK